MIENIFRWFGECAAPTMSGGGRNLTAGLTYCINVLIQYKEGKPMFRLLIAGWISLFVSIVLASSVPAGGDWIGAIQIAGTSIPFKTNFFQENAVPEGTITISTKGLRDKPLVVKTADPMHLEFLLETDAGNYDFKGELQDGRISGKVRSGEEAGTFEMIRVAGIEPSTYSQYFGIYQIEPDRYIYIRTWDELGKNQLTYFDNAGNAGALYPISASSFFSGPGLLNPVPVNLQLKFVQDPGGMRLVWMENGVPEKSGKKLAIHKEADVHFQNGEVTLAGTLFVPLSEGPHPAIVLVHGSGAVTRDYYGPIAYHFVRNGIAVLAYDKRGVGGSGGNWLESDFHDLAKDALAGLQLLKKQKEIDSRKIGMWGISQGGWVAPLAASLSADVAFLVIVSAPAVTPAEQQLQFVEAESRLQNAPEEKIQEIVQQTRSQFDTLRLEETRMELETEVTKLKEQRNTELLSMSGLENPLFLLFYRKIFDYDPIAVLEKTTCPVLLIYGDLDATVPLKGNRDRMESAIKKRGNTNYKTLIFERGNHALLESTTGSNSEFPYLKRFVPGFFDAVTQWILQLSELQALEKSL